MSEIANPSRERILARIGRALSDRVNTPASPSVSIFAPVTDPLARFLEECKANITECVLTGDDSDTRSKLHALLAGIPAGEISAEDAPGLRQLLSAIGRPLKWSSDGPPGEQCQATITQCHALVALTGSVLTSSACGGRGASIVAPVHIVVAHESQLVADLDAALRLICTQNLPMTCSYVGLITGCSRTGDIEKQLVIGAHGPRRLIVMVRRGS